MHSDIVAHLLATLVGQKMANMGHIDYGLGNLELIFLLIKHDGWRHFEE